LTSLVLLGQLWNDQMRIFNALDAGVAVRGRESMYRVFEIRSHGYVDELLPTARLVTCQREHVTLARAGDVYRLPAGAFHATRAAPRAEAVTIALGKTINGVANQALGRVESMAYQVPRRLISADETGKLASLIIDRLLSGSEDVRTEP
jgi:hypothetical protein